MRRNGEGEVKGDAGGNEVELGRVSMRRRKRMRRGIYSSSKRIIGITD